MPVSVGRLPRLRPGETMAKTVPRKKTTKNKTGKTVYRSRGARSTSPRRTSGTSSTSVRRGRLTSRLTSAAPARSCSATSDVGHNFVDGDGREEIASECLYFLLKLRVGLQDLEEDRAALLRIQGIEQGGLERLPRLLLPGPLPTRGHVGAFSCLVVTGEERGFANGRGEEIEELLLKLG
jgi:hypothetical protein